LKFRVKYILSIFDFQEGEDGIPMDENGQLIFSDVDYVDTWKAMEECVEMGLTKSIGVSTFNSKQIQRVLDVATIRPVVNQVQVRYRYRYNF
jgi:diketogulonate reductase-like aldo/keto reductase